MSTRVTLPSYFNFGTLYAFTRDVVSPLGHPRDQSFVFDFGRLSFIDGCGLTALSNTLEWLSAHQVKLFFDNHDDISRVTISYLDSCGFFRRYLGSAVSPHSQCKNTTLPFTKVAHADAFGWLEYTFTPWMSSVLSVQPDALGSVRTCVKEIFNNIKDHSTLDSGFIHVQHYPKVRNVRVTVSDFGRGIPASIRSKYGEMNDAAAILRASKAGVSSMSDANNRGVGLDLLVDTVTGNRGTVIIYSFQGRLTATSDAKGRQERIPSLGDGSYPGTLVDIMLKTDFFVGDDVGRGALEW